MHKQEQDSYVIGIDYGTDSVRSVLIDTQGRQHAEAIHYYKRWEQGLYCDADKNQFRHHPLDYLEGLEATLKQILTEVGETKAKHVRGISVDSTGSTPVAVNKEGQPLALTSGFEENPNAMFVLWKDHTAVKEAEEITQTAKSWLGTDYTKYVGGIYSSEWFWAKMLHILRTDKEICQAAYSWVELCDWIPFALTGGSEVSAMKRSRCAAGHKAMWHESFDGLPSEAYLKKVDPLLEGLRARLYRHTHTADEPAGTIAKEWADKLGLPNDVTIGVGAFDAHMGAVGAEIKPYYLSRVMGTSTCDILVAPQQEMDGKLVKGICGQVEGSVIPGMTGLEAGQSSFGDVYAWFKDVLLGPLEQIVRKNGTLTANQKEALIQDAVDQMIPMLSKKAASIEVDTGIIALDWLNGRRTPDANQYLQGAIEGLDLSTDAPKIFKALVEATCFGAKAIVERFQQEGIPIKGVIGLGGVAKKSPYIMQTLANVLDMPIEIAQCSHACARGTAMFAATASGLFPSVEEAQQAMGIGFADKFFPQEDKAKIYQKLYRKYQSLGSVIEDRTEARQHQTTE